MPAPGRTPGPGQEYRPNTRDIADSSWRTIVTGAADLADLTGIYRDLHAHPELSFAEHRTAGIVAARLRDLGYQTTTGVGRTGVVGLLANGDGPTVLLRADMDALPVLERTGLDYASTVRAAGAGGEDVPVMHACGHDAHVTCLLGAAAELAADTSSWSGTLLLVFQPAEEVGEGAQAMIDDGLFDRFGVPDVVLGQHVAPLPAGLLGVTSGPAFAGADALRVVLHGQGGHGSRPESAVDPVLMAAATVQRLHAIVSREVPAAEAAVVTVGALHAGTAPNIISDRAELLLSVRSFNQTVRGKVLKAIERIVTAEAAASGAPTAPEITSLGAFPVLVNDAAACARVSDAFAAGIGPGLVLDPGPVTGSEDVGLLATASGAPCAYWLLGSADPALFAGVTSLADAKAIVDTLPSNHSPLFAPVLDPTLRTGVTALTSAARAWLAASA
jgi:amidohydrolase